MRPGRPRSRRLRWNGPGGGRRPGPFLHCAALLGGASAFLVGTSALDPGSDRATGAPASAFQPLPIFKDGPPARTTGGFGEESCVGCHFGAEENDGVGRLVLEGVPERYVPGRRYALRVLLTRPGMAAGGFQLAARLEDGLTQAGTFDLSGDPGGRVGVVRERDVEFVHHTWDGATLSGPAEAVWEMVWVAPDKAGGSVHFHAAAVAADDDDSQGGDHVYTTVFVSGGG